MQTAPLRAFTLLEVVVVSALAFLLLTLTIQFILPAMRLSLRAQARTHMQQTCYLALHRLRADLENSNAAAIGFVNQGPGEPHTIVAIQPLLEDIVDVRPTYQQKLIVYLWNGSDDKLYRKLWDPDTFNFDQKFPTRLTLTQLHTLPTLAGAKESRQLSPDVTGFSFSSAIQSPNIANPIKIRLTLKHAEDTCSLEQSILLRNSP